MAIDTNVLALAALCRTYHGLDYDDAVVVARKTVELLEKNDTEADLLEKLDLVWGAALASGIIEPGDWAVPVDPRTYDERMLHSRISESWALHSAPKRPRPVEYDDPKFKPAGPVLKKNRRTTPDV